MPAIVRRWTELNAVYIDRVGDGPECTVEVRFGPNSDQRADIAEGPSCAMYGRRPRCKGKIGHVSETFGCSHVYGL